MAEEEGKDVEGGPAEGVEGEPAEGVEGEPAEGVEGGPAEGVEGGPVEEEEEAEEPDGTPKSELFRLALTYYWRTIVMIAWPLLCCVVFIIWDHKRKDVRCGYIVLVMAVYWACEVIPLPITASIPLVAWPMMGIADSGDAANAYFSPTCAMFFAGMVLAIAIRASNVHRRIALKLIICIGTTHRRLTFGLMACTMFVSMFISNAAATAMMAPVCYAIFEELQEQGLAHLYRPEEIDEYGVKIEHYPSRTARCYFLGIAYAATIGGIGTQVGTTTNLAYKGLFEERFKDRDDVNFLRWSLYAFLPSLAMTALCWLGLCVQYLGLWTKRGMDEEVRRQKEENEEEARQTKQTIHQVLIEKYDNLGNWKCHEIGVGIIFIIVVLLWIFRKPILFPGWADVVPSKNVNGTMPIVEDAVPGYLGIVTLFVIPGTLLCLYCVSKDPEKRPVRPGPALLVWRVLQQRMTWGLLWLLGGGFAVAFGIQKSGLSKTLGDQMKGILVGRDTLLVLAFCFFVTNFTELMSNTAICTIVVPVGFEIAVSNKIHPVYLTLPVAICCSFSFMLPVGTPPNAIVAGLVHIRARDMIVSGLWPTFETLAIVTATWPWMGPLIYNTTFPDWAV